VNTCSRCGEEFWDAEGDPNGDHVDVKECVRHLKESNDALKTQIENLETRFKRVVSRHNLDDSKYGRGW